MFPPPMDIPPGQERDFREGMLLGTAVNLGLIVLVLYVLRWLGVLVVS